jgi:putative transcriptional regulator
LTLLGRVDIVARLVASLLSSVSGARKAQGWTQQQLAESVGVSRQTVVEIEAGGYNPSTLLALRLAVLLDRPVEELFALPGEETARLRAQRHPRETPRAGRTA